MEHGRETVLEQGSRISVIVPVWQEAAGIVSALGALQDLRAGGAEVIVVDAGSPDGTGALAEPLCDRLVTSRKGRAVQMNAGAAVASGDVLVFLHADTRLPATAEGALAAFARSGRDWGRFDVRLSGRRPLFRVIAWFMNRRSRLTGICTGDQGMFMTRSAFASVGGFPEIPLMEDIEMSRRLRRRSRPFCVADPVVTDSRRWEQRGAWRTIWLMWRLRWRYWRGESPDSLALAYRSDVRHDQP